MKNIVVLPFSLVVLLISFTQSLTAQISQKQDEQPLQVTISSDKIQYAKTENIRISISNNLSQEIWYGAGFTAPFTTIYIENKTQKGWEEICPFIPAPTATPTPSEWIKRNAARIMAGQKIEISWNQQIHQYWGGDGKQVQPGKYRVKFIYYTFSFEEAKSWVSRYSWKEADKFSNIVYSNEFEIIE